MIEIDTNNGIACQVDRSKTREYAQEYYELLKSYEDRRIGISINNGRLLTVAKYLNKNDKIVDIGCGCGTFIKRYNSKNIYGYDINPFMVKRLRDKYIDIYAEDIVSFNGFIFWDSMEHIAEPSVILKRIPHQAYIFISIPIFKDITKIKDSKHYRPNEHYWYFTETGLKRYLNSYGYKFIEMLDFECKAGREDIYTFVFKKVK